MPFKPRRWFCDFGYTTFTVLSQNAGKYSLCVGDDNQIIGTYNSPEEAVIALSQRSTQNEEWNKYLADKSVPTKFSDWETDEDDCEYP